MKKEDVRHRKPAGFLALGDIFHKRFREAFYPYYREKPHVAFSTRLLLKDF